MDKILDGELIHHGIKGQKWGVRRTQAQLGHTSGVKKRISSVHRTKQKKSSKNVTKKKSVSEMTDTELITAINRKRLEKQYTEKVINEIAIPSVTYSAKNTTQKWVSKYLDKKLGLTNDDPMKAMQKVVNDMNTRKQYDELKDYFEKRNNKKLHYLIRQYLYIMANLEILLSEVIFPLIMKFLWK